MQRRASILARPTLLYFPPLSTRRTNRLPLRETFSTSNSRLKGLSTHGSLLQKPASISDQEWSTFGRNKKYRLSHAARIEDPQWGTEAPWPCKRCEAAGARCMVYTMEGQKFSSSGACSRCRKQASPCSRAKDVTVKWYRDLAGAAKSDKRKTLGQQLERAEAKNAELLAEIGRLKMVHDAFEEAKGENQRLRAEMEELREWRQEKRAGDAATNDSAQAIERLRDHASTFPRIPARLKTDLAILQRLEQYVGSRRTVQEYMQAVKEKRARLRQEQEGLTEAIRHGRRMEKTLPGLEREVQKLRRQNARCEEDVSERRKSIEEETGSLMKERARLQEQVGENTRARMELKNPRRTNKRLMNKLKTAETDSLSEESEDFEAVARMREDLRRASKEKEGSEQVVRKLKGDVKSAKQECQGLKRESQDLKKEVKRLQGENKEFAGLREENGGMKAELARLGSMRESPERAAAELQSVKAEVGRLKIVIEAQKGLRVQNEGLRKEVLGLTKEMEKMKGG